MNGVIGVFVLLPRFPLLLALAFWKESKKIMLVTN